MGYCIVGYDKSGEGEDQYINIDGWHQLRSIARLYGWKPQGTTLDVWTHKTNGEKHYSFRPSEYSDDDGEWGPAPDWDGSYDSNDGQEISESDAANLAQALERLLADLPYNKELCERQSKRLNDGQREKLRGWLISWSDPRGIEVITNMIAVLKRGDCRIL